MVTFTHTKMRLNKNLFYFQFESIIFNIFVESLISVGKLVCVFLGGIAEKSLNRRFYETLAIDMTKIGGWIVKKENVNKQLTFL